MAQGKHELETLKGLLSKETRQQGREAVLYGYWLDNLVKLKMFLQLS